jgi:DnaJ-class molecular chaperone
MNPYKILGVEQSATPDEIKSAYRKLASKHHPDRGGDTKHFQEIQSAYDMLTDPNKRGQHDFANFANQTHHFHGFPFGFNPFEQMFSQFNNQRRRLYTLAIVLTLEQVAKGGKEQVQINTPNGSQFVDIDIPQGVDENQTFRYENLLPDGDLQIQFKIQPHHKFERNGLDLTTALPVNIFELIIGTKLTIYDIHGKSLDVNVPPMTKPNSKLRIANKGLVNYGQMGDLYILIQALLPDKITTETINQLKKELSKE